MTGYSHHDERMVDWLGQGPWDPPPEVVEAAVAYARRHPRRGPRFAGLRRSLMSGIHLAPVQQRPAANRSLFIALATVTAAVVVTIGLVGGMNLLGPADQPGGGPASSATSSPLPSAPPSLPSTPVAISGSMSDCALETAGTENLYGYLTHLRGLTVRCNLTASDGRIQGPVKVVYSGDRPDYAPAANFETWGTISIDAPDGLWVGVWRGTTEPQPPVSAVHHTMTGVLLGRGGQAGLRVRWTLDNLWGDSVTGGINLLDTSFNFTGVLESTATIPPDGTTLISGSSSCADVQAGTRTVVGDVTGIRDAVIECSGIIGSDPRLEGRTRTVLNGDQVADESATLWGTEEVRVQDQVTWRGEYTGTVAAGFTTHRLEGSYVGYGAYDGLRFEWTTIGDPYWGYVTSGRIVAGPWPLASDAASPRLDPDTRGDDPRGDVADGAPDIVGLNSTTTPEELVLTISLASPWRQDAVADIAIVIEAGGGPIDSSGSVIPLGDPPVCSPWFSELILWTGRTGRFVDGSLPFVPQSEFPWAGAPLAATAADAGLSVVIPLSMLEPWRPTAIRLADGRESILINVNVGGEQGDWYPDELGCHLVPLELE